METHPLGARTGRFPWQAALLFVAAAAISRAPALIVLAVGAVITWLVVEITGRLALAAVDAPDAFGLVHRDAKVGRRGGWLVVGPAIRVGLFAQSLTDPMEVC